MVKQTKVKRRRRKDEIGQEQKVAATGQSAGEHIISTSLEKSMPVEGQKTRLESP
jgi:hypothetical protein